MKNCTIVYLIVLSIFFTSCTGTRKKKEVTVSHTAIEQPHTVTGNDNEEEDQEYEDEGDYYEEDPGEIEARNEKYQDITQRISGFTLEEELSRFFKTKLIPGKDQTIVLFPQPTPGENEYDNQSFYMRLFIFDNKTDTIIAHLEEDILLVSDALVIEGLSLSITSYGIIQDNTEFAVEVQTAVMGRGSPYSGTSVYLFVCKDGYIRNVLENYVINSYSTEWVSELEVINTSINREFTVDHQSTTPFRDITVSVNTVYEHNILDPDNDETTIRETNGKEILQYQDGKYLVVPVDE